MTDQEIRLKFGEMNAGEMRLARSLVGWHERETAKLKEDLTHAERWRDKLDTKLTEVVEAAERAGWGDVENSKNLPTFITYLAEDLSKAQAELAAAKGEWQAQEVPQVEAKAEPATFEAHGKTWTRHTPGDPMPCDGEAWVNWLLESEFNGSFPYRNNSTLARNLGKFWTGIIGWRYADEPALTQPTTSPGWTPAVGDTVRLKSGGPAMTVTGVDPLSLMCAWMNADDELQVEPITTLCLEPAKP